MSFIKINLFYKKYLPLTFFVLIFIISQVFLIPTLENSFAITSVNLLTIFPIVYLMIFQKSYSFYKLFVNFTIYAVPVTALAFIILFLFKPYIADQIAQEDFIIEILTALAALLASILLIISSIYLLSKRQILLAATSFVICLSFFIIGMEEISWGQRIFNIESSPFFTQHNMQAETNLHNLNSSLTMAIFYSIIFVIFIMLPFYKSYVSKLLAKLNMSKLKLFIPSLWIIPVVAVSYGFNVYNQAYYIFIIVFTLLALSYYVFNKKSELNNYRSAIVLSITTTLICLIFFALFNFEGLGIRTWLPSEYREFFICVTLLIYSIDLLFRINQDKTIYKEK